MRPSLLSALWIVLGVCVVAASVGLLVGLVAEWSVIAGAVKGGSFDMVLVIEAAIVAAIVFLLVGATRRAKDR